jgi:hypothetical protein
MIIMTIIMIALVANSVIGKVLLRVPCFCVGGAKFLNVNIPEVQFWASHVVISFVTLGNLPNFPES